MSPIIKKKRKTFEIPSKYWLLFLTVFCIALMIFSFRTDLFDGPLKAAASYVVVPFQRGIAAAGGYLSDRAKELGELKDVLAENQRLKEEVDALTIENSQLQQDRFELSSLRELYQLDQAYADYEKIGARVIASDSSNWFYSFTIDKGSNDGILVDANVMAGSGLVGRVVDVGPDYAVVQSVISDNHHVSAMILSSSEKMMVTGDLQLLMTEGAIRFDQLSDKDNRAVVGDKVVTSYISDKYLPGILIGYISSINTSANNLTKSGTLTPAVDFENLQEVLVITELKQQTG